jgi:SAM-dependent methyltransferase
MKARDWWKTLFNNTAWIDVDFRLRSNERIATDVDGIIRLAKLRPPKRILDIACGVGRHCRILAEYGFDVIGVDYSIMVLQEAQKRIANSPVSIKFICADMRSLPFANHTFDCAINLYTSWGYFESDDENLSVLFEAYRCLRPGGSLVLDYTNQWWPPNRKIRRHFEDAGFRYTREAEFDEESGLYFGVEVYEWLDRREVRRDEWRIKIYRPEKLVNFLHQAGFTLIELYGDWQGSPLREDSPRIIAVATKP